ncbi:FAD-binding protein [Paracoccus tegillarcae]|uniref:2-hydroxy-acid oxidase n=1 Tax=Paracoccus tegillarcae TaxID=1529068 RepID=A0A2K9EZE2_9RHOB|nr:FAD-binding protein [Paracoccus tegillarcae]AUH32261.1 2-hydroxy-acid oxidase [Paracoccus tegillarcae]
MQPETELALADIIRKARAPLSIIGGGTRLRPGEGQADRLRTTALRGITLYEPEALILVVRAGTPLADVQAALKAEGQMLGFEPDARPGSTIGGVVAANASGPRRVQVGACRDALIGVRFVTGDGQIVKNGGRVMKNVTGYDLSKLMAGSRGTLGVLTELSFRTTPIAPVSQTLSLPGLDATAAIAALTSALTGPYEISGAAWLPGHGAILRLEGLERSVSIRRKALSARLAEFGELTEGDPQAWLLLHPNIHSDGDLWRIICRPGEAPALIASLPHVVAVDWGGALIHALVPAGTQPALPKFSGHATRISGDTQVILPAPDPVTARLNAELQGRFDPRAILQGAG